MASKNASRDRFKYGICLNEDCPKAKTKEIQQISMRNDLVCKECGSELRECPPPKQFDPKPYIIIAVVLLIIAGGVYGGFYWKQVSDEKAELQRIAALEQARLDSIAQAQADSIAAIQLAEQQAIEQARLDSIEQVRLDSIAAEQARLDSIAKAQEDSIRLAKEKTKKQAVKRLDNGKWSGPWKNGKPHGTGTFTYTVETRIDSRDPQKRIAKVGDYIIGEYYEGRLVQGRWYDKNNNIKGSIIIGR